MPYDEMDQANQANCDRIAATLLSGALMVAAIGTTIGVSAGSAPQPKPVKCELKNIVNCVAVFPGNTMVSIQGKDYCLSWSDWTKREILLSAPIVLKGKKQCAAG
jgi:hypothetical protein